MSTSLILCLALGFPSAFVLRSISDKSPQVKATTSLCLGLSTAFLFCGFHAFYLLVSSFVTWSLVSLFSKAKYLLMVLNFCFLLWGYVYYASDEYDISWTTPQAVLCLRLIGFLFDYTEKTIISDSSMAFNGDLSIKSCSILEFLSYCFFPGAFLVGPQFSFVFFQKYLRTTKFPEGSIQHGIKCLKYAAVYSVVYCFSDIFSPKKLPSESNIFLKLGFVWLGGKIALTKYLLVWLISESICSFSLLSNNGSTWDALSNIDVPKYEFPQSLNDIVASFNINTNKWAKHYLFKRFKFLKSKALSSILTLSFLALWHGFHFGYFFAFSLEFFDFLAEEKLKRFNYRNKFLSYFLTTSALYYSAFGFDLLTWDRIIVAFNQLYWIGHVIVFLILLK